MCCFCWFRQTFFLVFLCVFRGEKRQTDHIISIRIYRDKYQKHQAPYHMPPILSLSFSIKINFSIKQQQQHWSSLLRVVLCPSLSSSSSPSIRVVLLLSKVSKHTHKYNNNNPNNINSMWNDFSFPFSCSLSLMGKKNQYNSRRSS